MGFVGFKPSDLAGVAPQAINTNGPCLPDIKTP